MDLNDRIQCRICGRFFGSLIKHLIIRHRMAPAEYKRKYGVSRVMAETVRYRLGLSLVERGWGKKAWTEDLLLQAIREQAKTPEGLAGIHVKRARGNLFQVATERFGSWGEAVRRAGFDYADVSLTHRWTAEEVCAKIRALRRAGQPVNHLAARAADAHLVSAARTMYGSWDQALAAAGLDPAKIRKSPVARNWTKDSILEEIGRRRDAGKDLAPGTMAREAYALLGAAVRHFGSWRKALARVGIRTEDCYRIPLTKWTRARVLEAIRAEHAAGRSLAIAEVQRRFPALDYAVNRFFPGAWHTALTHAGLDPLAYLKQEQWSQQRVIEALRAHAQEGVDLGWARTRATYSKLAKAARRWFGSWDAALVAAGVKRS